MLECKETGVVILVSRQSTAYRHQQTRLTSNPQPTKAGQGKPNAGPLHVNAGQTSKDKAFSRQYEKTEYIRH